MTRTQLGVKKKKEKGEGRVKKGNEDIVEMLRLKGLLDVEGPRTWKVKDVERGHSGEAEVERLKHCSFKTLNEDRVEVERLKHS